jgi:hypothetical protein
VVTRVAVTVLVATALFASARLADAHPLHTTLTEVTVTPATRTIRATVRLFADDLGSGVARRRGSAAADADVTSYVASTLTLLEGSRALATRSCGVRRAGEVVWVCLEANLDGSSQTVTARNAVLCEVFADQVNIVQVTSGSSKRSVLFTRGDGAKRLF